jgi:hypothetical protein
MYQGSRSKVTWWLVKADADSVKGQSEGVGIGLEDDVIRRSGSLISFEKNMVDLVAFFRNSLLSRDKLGVIASCYK